MKMMPFLAPALILFGLAGTAPVSAKEVDESLIEALRAGGKVVLLRHTDAEGGDPELSMRLTSPKDCAQEANLTETGRLDARRLGAWLGDEGIAVTAVFSGEFCRTLQTAEEVFGHSGEPWNALNLYDAMPATESDFLMEDVNDRITDFSGPGNLFLVTHRPNINHLTFVQTEPGDMVVVESDGFGGFNVLGLLPAR